MAYDPFKPAGVAIAALVAGIAPGAAQAAQSAPEAQLRAAADRFAPAEPFAEVEEQFGDVPLDGF